MNSRLNVALQSAAVLAIMLVAQVVSCQQYPLRASSIQFAGVIWDYFPESPEYLYVHYDIGLDHGKGLLNIIDVSIQDEKANRLPLLKSFLAPGKSPCYPNPGEANWYWGLTFDPKTTTRVVIEAHITLGHGVYEVKSVLVKKARDKPSDDRGPYWELVREESTGKWIPPMEWTGPKP